MNILYIIIKYLGSCNRSKSWFYVMVLVMMMMIMLERYWKIILLVNTGRERLIRSHSSARFCFELSGNSN